MSGGIGSVLLMQTIKSAYLQCLRSVVATQTTAITFVSSSLSSQNMHVQRELSLLNHIQPTSILITQLRAKREAVLLRERVLSDTVTEQDELIHRESKPERQRGRCYIVWKGNEMGVQ